MRTVLRWVFRAIVAVAVLVAGVWVFGPREPVDFTRRFIPASIGADPDAYLASIEARLPDIRPGSEKRILWAGDRGRKTPLSIVYLHGFLSASEDIRPLPDRVAEALGANLYFARLSGHGRDRAALSETRVADWVEDLDEALAIGSQIGERVIILSTSTGATLAAAGLAEGRGGSVAGLVMISPNFRVANPTAALLTLPAARTWVPLLVGQERPFEQSRAVDAAWWRTAYPTAALFPMAALVRHAASADYGAVEVPAMFVFADTDRVVDHRSTRDVAARWGGPATLEIIAPGDGDDPSHHLIAGDILSPGLTDRVTAAIAAWAGGL